ncbi:beta strand repeat-containing protein, partial [Inquilinus sp.]|uniref:beta strand repeat-containing protein n=1 Tax=Inquilinus sp. TaxID=1932117 RepID=UPI0037833D38
MAQHFQVSRVNARARPLPLRALLLGTAAWLIAPGEAAAQQSCGVQGNSYTCTVAGGTYTSPGVGTSEPPSNISAGQNLVVNSYGTFDVVLTNSNDTVLGNSAYGSGDTYGITINNQGSITASASPGSFSQYAFGIWAQQGAGSGNPGGNTNSDLQIMNSGSIFLEPTQGTIGSGAAIWASDEGGAGTSGGAGGSSYGAQINNSGGVSATAAGQYGFAGLQVFSRGGDGSSGGPGNGGGAGGNGGYAYISNISPVFVDWTWQNAGSTSYGVYGLQAQSQGGNGNWNSSSPGGNGGDSGIATVKHAGGDVIVTMSGTPPSPQPTYLGAGIMAAAFGGSGGEGPQSGGDDNQAGGNGGSAAGATIQVSGNAGVSTTGDRLPGLLVYGVGGAGALSGCQDGDNCNPDQSSAHNNGGNGGGVVLPSDAVSVVAEFGAIPIATAGTDSAGVAVVLQGGTGGAGGSEVDFSQADGGAGGNGGNIQSTANINFVGMSGSPISVTTSGGTSPGILVASIGGNAGDAGDAQGTIGSAFGGDGGAGGSSAGVTVALASTAISTQGANSSGIVVRSEGGIGGGGGSGAAGIGEAGGGGGGNGGNGGDLSIWLDGASSITTQGAGSFGIVAQSFSGAGGDGSGETGDAGSGGNGGVGGDAGNVTISNAATITTAQATGILAQSVAGAGGGGGGSYGVFGGSGGTGASAGSVGTIDVSNTGSITTSGAGAKGVLAQSLGGSGGVGGDASGGLYTVGGNATSNVFEIAGNTVTISLTSGGSVATSGVSAFGLLGQSIGGGGGDGGSGAGLGAAVGGAGGAGGAGGTVQATIDTQSQVVTTGDNAAAVVMQSIGGGGGNAGNASSTGLFASVALGGTGGSGGDGGTGSITTNGAMIATAGSKAAGLVAQSIGGGGGTGGNALAGSVGPGFSAAVAVGGTAGGGGNGGTASATVVGGLISTGQNDFLVNGGTVTNGLCGTVLCNTLPIDSFGAVVQSIGGGGGLGGNASAEALAIAVPVDPDGNQVGVAVGAAVGGTGGSGGSGGTAQFALSDGGSIVTRGQGSTGVLVQSIGGGGGAGGDSSASAMVVGYGQTVPEDAGSLGVAATFQIGGSGGGGNNGGSVLVAIGGTVSNGALQQDAAGSAGTSIVTYGDYANGVTAHSIGGGGGNGGFGGGTTQEFGTGSSTAIAANLGSTGGGGGAGGDVQVSLFDGSSITTYGSGAVGILGQSVGGGGGASQGASMNVAQTIAIGNVSYKPGLNLSLGITGGGGGNGGEVTVDVQGGIATHGGDATGVLAQSVGGGGGLGGSAGSDGSADNPIIQLLTARQAESNLHDYLSKGSVPFDTTFALAIGGAGGAGGLGGTVNVDLSAPIATAGDWANGIVAQSIGGGGGKGGSSAAAGTGGVPEITVNLELALGGQGGGGGDGGDVTVNLNQDAALATSGYAASAVVAQSVGAGGGIGADGSDSATGWIAVGASTGGKGGVGGNGGSVLLQYDNTAGTNIMTTGAAADGIVLQSIGGGGGVAGAGSSLFESEFGYQTGSMQLSLGGGRDANGDGGAVTLQAGVSDGNPLNITTTGNYAFGILAQSIGGGGGIITAQPSAPLTTQLAGGQSSGDGGAVNITANNVNIVSSGFAAHGIVAQSIGSGGGVMRVTDPNTGTIAMNTWYSPSSANPGLANGGAVAVELDNGGNIQVAGAGAVGILAQSLGGGGGLYIDGSTMNAGVPDQYISTCGENACYGVGRAVTVTVDSGSVVSSTGTNGIGVFAQSSGYGGSGGPVNVTVNGTVSGGGGTAATNAVAGGAGVQIDTPGFSQPSTLYVMNGGTVTTVLGTSGTAFLGTSGGTTYLYTNGDATVTGSVYTGPYWAGALDAVTSGPAPGVFENHGTYNSGNVVRGLLYNLGLVNLGMPGEVRVTRVEGGFLQTAEGRLGVTIDSLNGKADQLNIIGEAKVGGTIVPTALTLLPGTLPVVTADHLTSTADGLDSLLFHWDTAQSGNTLTLAPRSDFSPGGVSLSKSQSSLAAYHSRAWNNSDAAFATRFAELSRISDAGDYKTALDAYSSKATHAQSIALANSAGTILGAAMSCPVFVDQNVLLGEDNCVWA